MQPADGGVEHAQHWPAEWWDRCPHLEPSSDLTSQARLAESTQAEWAAEGAAPSCRGGEPEQVGDRSRAQSRSPERTDVSACGRIAGIVCVPNPRSDYGSGPNSPPQLGTQFQNTSDSARMWRGVRRDGRTYISTDTGRCRILTLHSVN